MKGIIRIGDKTTGGGTVISGSADMKFLGIGVARVGDAVTCLFPATVRRWSLRDTQCSRIMAYRLPFMAIVAPAAAYFSRHCLERPRAEYAGPV